MRPAPLATLLLCLAAASGPALADRDALWHIIDGRCVPAAASAAEMPAPCARVDRAEGWATMKDRRGVLQYLLLPTARISGIESPALLDAGTPDYFAQSWRSRDLLDRLRGQPLPREAVSLALNPVRRRSQDQLHIHISCVRPELLAKLSADEADLSPTSWTPLRGGWLNHAWFVKRVDGETLEGVNPIADVAAHLPGAAEDMGGIGVSVVATTFKGGQPGFVLMATRWNPDDRSSGSAEHDVQDHDCAILSGSKTSKVTEAQTSGAED